MGWQLHINLVFAVTTLASLRSGNGVVAGFTSQQTYAIRGATLAMAQIAGLGRNAQATADQA